MDAGERRVGGETEDVGGFVFAAEVTIEATENTVVGQQDVNFADKSSGRLGRAEIAGKAGPREPERTPRVSLGGKLSWGLEGNHAFSLLPGRAFTAIWSVPRGTRWPNRPAWSWPNRYRE